MIRIIKKLYENATLTTNVQNLLSEDIPISKGILQGDSLSTTVQTLHLRPRRGN